MTITVGGTTGLTFPDSSTQNTAATGFGFKNMLFNGAMQIWQRGTSAAGSYPTYLADRWMNYRSTTGSTYSRQATSDTTNLPNIQYCQRIQRDSGNTSVAPLYISQSLETNNSITAAGSSVTISFYARAGATFSAASGNMSVEVVYGTGTDQNVIAGFTGQTNAVSTTKTLTTTWQRFTATGNIPATATQLAVNLYYTPVGTAGATDYMEITGVQLEKGSTATSFDCRPYGTELALCQRYLPVLYCENGTYLTTTFPYSTTTSGPVIFKMPTTTRVPPTGISLTGSASNFGIGDGDSGASLSSLTFSTGTTDILALNWGTSSSRTAFRPHTFYCGTATNILGTGCEL